MKMAKAIKAVRNEEIGLKKTSKMFQVSRSKLKNKINSEKTDQYVICSESSVFLHS
jgi:hypothetical protein